MRRIKNNRLIQKYGGQMITNRGGPGTSSGQAVFGREGACHRVESAAVPHGLDKIQEAIFLAEIKLKNK